MTSLFDFGPGTYGSSGLSDSIQDQRAIERGYKSSPKYKLIIKSQLEDLRHLSTPK